MKTYHSIWAAVFFICYIFIIVFSGGGWNLFFIKWDFENSGQFGDSFGPLTSLFSAFAAVSAFQAYRTQRQQLEDAKNAMANDKIENEKRDFDQTFFRMLEFLRSVVRDLDVDELGIRYHGTDAFQRIRIQVARVAKRGENKESVGLEFRQVYKRYQNDLGHYFRMCYHIVKFIDNTNYANKKFYSQIFRANLSNSELVLLGLNAAFGSGKTKFKPLIEKYSILHNISADDASLFFLVDEFEIIAFGDRDIKNERLGD